MQKFSISLPEATVSDIDAAATAAGIPRAEYIRELCTSAIVGGNPGSDDANPGTLAETIGTLERTREDLAQITAERDRLAAELRTAEDQARTAAADRDRLTAEAETAAAAREGLASRVREIEEGRHTLEIRAVRAEVLAERLEAERDQAREDLARAEASAAKVIGAMEGTIEGLKKDKALFEGLFTDERRRSERYLPAEAGPSAGTVEAAAPVKRSIWDRILGRGTV